MTDERFLKMKVLSSEYRKEYSQIFKPYILLLAFIK